MKKKLQNIGLIALSIILCLIILELFFRLFSPTRDYSSKNDRHLIQPDSLLSYRYASNLDTNLVTIDYRIDIKTNRFGFRDGQWNFDTTQTNLLVLGNSFSAGFGVDNEERWSSLLDIKLSALESPATVYNAAISGYSITQSIDNGIQLSKLIQPEIIIVGLYLNSLDRLDDPFQYYKGFSVKKSAIPYAKVSNEELFFSFWKADFLKNIDIFFKKHSMLYQFAEQRIRYRILPSMRRLLNSKSKLEETSGEYSSLSQAAFDELIRLQSSVSAEIYLLPIIQHNREFEIFENQVKIYRDLTHLISDSEIQFIDILPQFESEIKKGTDMWIKNDPHWNKKAHSLAARVISEQLFH